LDFVYFCRNSKEIEEIDKEVKNWIEEIIWNCSSVKIQLNPFYIFFIRKKKEKIKPKFSSPISPGPIYLFFLFSLLPHV